MFKVGKVSYIMTLFWTAISWEVFALGAVGLIFEVSSPFCNVMTALGLPLVQILAVVIFRDKMDGVKVISMVLAIWGSVSSILMIIASPRLIFKRKIPMKFPISIPLRTRLINE